MPHLPSPPSSARRDTSRAAPRPGSAARAHACSALVGACGLLWLLSGCASDNSMNDQGFGSSVRHQIAIQTANPGLNAHGLDGQKVSAALTSYRQDVASPQSVDSAGLGAVTTGGGGK